MDFFKHTWKIFDDHAIVIPSYEHTLPVHYCHNFSLGFMTKARAYKGEGQGGSLGVTSHASGSVGECEGMNPPTLK